MKRSALLFSSSIRGIFSDSNGLLLKTKKISSDPVNHLFMHHTSTSLLVKFPSLFVVYVRTLIHVLDMNRKFASYGYIIYRN